MNTLDWVVKELLDSIKKYIADNKAYFEHVQFGLNSPADKTAPKTDVDSGAGAITAPVVAGIASQENAVDTGASLSSPALTPGLFSWLKLSVEGSLFTDINLKSEKVNDAYAFVVAIEKILNKPAIHETTAVSLRLKEFKQEVENEIEKMKNILLKYGRASGEYDALLRVFSNMLVWMLQERQLEVLCIALKFETLDKPSKINGGSQFTPPIPATKEMVTYLVRQMMILHLDEARDCEKEKLKYQRILPEIESENITRMCMFAVEATYLYSQRFPEPHHRLDNTYLTIQGLRQETGDIHAGMSGYFTTVKNEFLIDMLGKLSGMSTVTKNRIKDREEKALSRKMGTTSPSPSSLGIS